MSNNKYENLSLKELLVLSNDENNKNNLELAEALYETLALYKRITHPHADTPFSIFVEKIRDNMETKQKLEHNLSETLAEYLISESLTILIDTYGLHIKLYSGKYKHDSMDILQNDYIRLYITPWLHSWYCKYIKVSWQQFLEILLSTEYNTLLKERIPIFIQEYYSLHNRLEPIDYYEKNPIFTYIEANNPQQILSYLITYPVMYDCLKQIESIDMKNIARLYLSSFRATYFSKYNIKDIQATIKKIIFDNYYNDEEFLLKCINTKNQAFMAIYFSKRLKNILRKDINLAILCYKNSYTRYRKIVKRMLGKNVTSSQQFKYIFG